jgi:histidyl-tRNA synthetase
MMAADTMEALGIARGDYVIRVNNRKVLDGVMEAIGLAGEPHAGTRLAVLRAIDKLDRLGTEGVRDLLGEGRLDESGDFTKGAGLDPAAVQAVISFLDPAAAATGAGPFAEMAKAWRKEASKYYLAWLESFAQLTPRGREGVAELAEIRRLVDAAGYGDDRITIDPACVRGLEYYTGPVFEAELTFEVKDDKGRPVRFGSVGGGGRYDGLVGRFRGEDVPATGFSVGVSRLTAALAAQRGGAAAEPVGPVVVAGVEEGRIADDQKRTAERRAARNAAGGPPVPVEMYLGGSGMKAQLKYADRRNAPCVVIQGSDERERGEVQVKDLVEGKRIAATIEDNVEWREARPAQVSVPLARLAETVREILARHGAHGLGAHGLRGAADDNAGTGRAGGAGGIGTGGGAASGL